MKKEKPKIKMPRVQAQFNTGSRIERPERGKGSYQRKKDTTRRELLSCDE